MRYTVSPLMGIARWLLGDSIDTGQHTHTVTSQPPDALCLSLWQVREPGGRPATAGAR